MPRPPGEREDDSTRMGHESSADVKEKDVAAARGRVRDMLSAAILRYEARTRGPAEDAEMTQKGNQAGELDELKKIRDAVVAGKAHTVERLLRENLPNALDADRDMLLEADRTQGV